MKKLLMAIAAAGLLAIGLSARVASAQDIQVCTGSPATNCTPYQSIQTAINNAPNNAVIKIPSGERTEGNIKIEDKNLTIRGASPRGTIVQAASTPCAVPGRVFQISSARVTIEDLTIRHGCILSPTQPSLGGGIWNAGTLTLRRVIVTNNTVWLDEPLEAGASPWTPRGGGIYSVGSLKIYDSAILTNSVISSAGTALGGGLYNNGDVYIVNSTISGNTAQGTGGGQIMGGAIYNAGSLEMEYNTVVQNTAVNAGGAISNAGDLVLINNLFHANEPPFSEVVCNAAARASLPAKGEVEGQSEPQGVQRVDADICEDPVPGVVALGDLITDTLVPVFIPSPESIALIDKGVCARSEVTVDQRGSMRGQGNECDLGSVELGFSYMPVLVSSPPMPDLIVRQVTVEPAGPLDSGTQVTIKVVIENIGNKATESGFYIDLLINPRETPPNHGGFTWANFCRSANCASDQGIVWQAPLTIYPKERFTFTSNLDVDPYARRQSSKWTKYFAPGEVRIWAFVDSYEANGSQQGYIAERREDNNRYEVPVFTVTQGRLPDSFGSASDPAVDPFAPRPHP